MQQLRRKAGRSGVPSKSPDLAKPGDGARAEKPARGGLDTPYLWSPSPSAQTFSLSEQIAEKIGNAIIRGEYSPGDKLQEQQLIARFKVSRGPIREALRILERDGLVRVAARRGAQVSSLSQEEVRHLFDIRVALFGLAAKLVAEQQDADFIPQFAAATESLPAIARSGDVDAYVNLTYRLGTWLADASANKHLGRIFFSLAHQTLRYARLGLSTVKRREQSARNWRKIAAAIQAQDAKLAQQMAEQLLRDSRNMAVKLLSQGGEKPA